MEVALTYLFNKFVLGIYLGGLAVLFFQLFSGKFDRQGRVNDAIFGKYFRIQIGHVIALLWWPLTVIVTPVIAILFDRSELMFRKEHSMLKKKH